ncbi:MAG: hypothetical protein R3B54_09930 [Bdellovibrionota bacterium]
MGVRYHNSRLLLRAFLVLAFGLSFDASAHLAACQESYDGIALDPISLSIRRISSLSPAQRASAQRIQNLMRISEDSKVDPEVKQKGQCRRGSRNP